MSVWLVSGWEVILLYSHRVQNSASNNRVVCSSGEHVCGYHIILICGLPSFCTKEFVWPRDHGNPQWNIQRQSEEESHFKKTPGKSDMKDFATKLKTLARIIKCCMKSKTGTWARPPVGLPGSSRWNQRREWQPCLSCLFVPNWLRKWGWHEHAGA